MKQIRETAQRLNNSTIEAHWRSLRLLTFYRLILSGFLTILHFSLRDANPFDALPGGAFASTLVIYIAFSLAAGFSARLRWPRYFLQTLLQLLADTCFIILLMHASGGISSSLSVLILVVAIASALLLPGRIAFLLTAIATLLILGESGYNILTLEQPATGIITQAGLLGMALFATTALGVLLSTRVRDSEALAAQRGLDLANLEQLNHHIIQHLQSGVLVVGPDNKVRMSNATANQLLQCEQCIGTDLSQISAPLNQQKKRWSQDPGWQPENISTGSENQYMAPRFSAMTTSHGQGTLILLDDSNTLTKQTQQSKLASLGRLSASIAHEIRNPLGAISHAAQLLEESKSLDNDDKRLAEIIHNHTQRVNLIIENVLQLSRRTPVDTQRINIKTWIDDFIEEFSQAEQLTTDCIHSSITPENVTLNTDPGHLHQVLWNLCKNAVRHATDPKRVDIRMYQNNDQTVTLDIIDNGPGIPPGSADKIFEPFYTTDSQGTGLGLYLARTLCEINQSQLSYHNDNGKSCFRIHFTAL
ncbi:MAG: HAMP domain-containing sensor histidine kinase [Gammaproteobacteria bacterium]